MLAVLEMNKRLASCRNVACLLVDDHVPIRPNGCVQLPDIPWKTLETATRIERATCGVRITKRKLLKCLSLGQFPLQQPYC